MNLSSVTSVPTLDPTPTNDADLHLPTSQRYAIQRVVHASDAPTVACWGADHVVLAVNAAALRVLPRPARPAGGPFRATWPVLQSSIGPMLDAALAGHPNATDESRCGGDRPPQGRTECYASRVSPLRASDGTLVGAFWTFTDVTADAAQQRFFGNLLRQVDLRVVLVALASQRVEWLSPAAVRHHGLPDAYSAVDRPVGELLPEAVVRALQVAAASAGTLGSHVAVAAAGVRYVLLPVLRPGAEPSVLVYAHPA